MGYPQASLTRSHIYNAWLRYLTARHSLTIHSPFLCFYVSVLVAVIAWTHGITMSYCLNVARLRVQCVGVRYDGLRAVSHPLSNPYRDKLSTPARCACGDADDKTEAHRARRLMAWREGCAESGRTAGVRAACERLLNERGIALKAVARGTECWL